jgi:hypothetical protein
VVAASGSRRITSTMTRAENRRSRVMRISRAKQAARSRSVSLAMSSAETPRGQHNHTRSPTAVGSRARVIGNRPDRRESRNSPNAARSRARVTMHPTTALIHRRDRRHHTNPTAVTTARTVVHIGPICSAVSCQTRISSTTSKISGRCRTTHLTSRLSSDRCVAAGPGRSSRPNARYSRLTTTTTDAVPRSAAG